MKPKMMEVERVKPATEGLTFKLKIYRAGSIVPMDFTVGPKCDKSGGQWVCATHGEAFGNNMQKDSHIDKGKHVIAWLCNHHGPEVP